MGGIVPGILWVEASNAAKHPSVLATTLPPTKNDLAQSNPSGVIEKPWSRPTLGSEEGLRGQDTLKVGKLRPREGKGTLKF